VTSLKPEAAHSEMVEQGIGVVDIFVFKVFPRSSCRAPLPLT
jgi:hypothetical protein